MTSFWDQRISPTHVSLRPLSMALNQMLMRLVKATQNAQEFLTEPRTGSLSFTPGQLGNGFGNGFET